MREPTLVLAKGRQASLLRRHPWVFAGSVAEVHGRPGPGDTVVVRAADGAFLARAAYSPSSAIRARVWSFDEHEAVDEALVAGRVRSAAQRRARLASRTNATRLVFAESDGLPGLVADRYDDTVVCEFTSVGADRWREAVADALAGLPGVVRVEERSDVDVRAREGLAPRTGTLRGDPAPDRIAVHEDGRRALVDVARGHKTGWYLDQRDNRAVVEQLAAGRRVLDVCAYTGGFSVAAFRGGATEVVSVDSSGPALALAGENLALNGYPSSGLHEADAFADLRRRRDRAERWDLVVLDPPKLAAHAGQVDRAARAYKDLNLSAFKLLAPGGVLVTFSCSGAVGPELFQKIVAGAALDARREARITRRLAQAEDHPVLLSFPEADYLCGLVVEV